MFVYFLKRQQSTVKKDGKLYHLKILSSSKKGKNKIFLEQTDYLQISINKHSICLLIVQSI